MGGCRRLEREAPAVTHVGIQVLVHLAPRGAPLSIVAGGRPAAPPFHVVIILQHVGKMSRAGAGEEGRLGSFLCLDRTG